MNAISVTRTIKMPDPLRLSRYRKTPELGPSLLFFSGGSALDGASRVLKNYTHNSTHLVTSFDSGGSSAKLRHAFEMPSIGDMRSRMMALADETVTGHPEVYQLFTYRLPAGSSDSELRQQLESMIQGDDPLVSTISNPMRRLIRNQLGFFRKVMPEAFDLRGASIGNLILAGGYLNNHKHLDPIIFLFSKLVGVLGTVRAIVNQDLYLCAELGDGSQVCGQHRMTGKEVAPIESPIRNLSLSSALDDFVPVKVKIKKKNRKLIERADMICFPPGSFYSSLIANLLPKGVASAIAANKNPKVFIPNLGRDPEQFGMTLDQSVRKLLKYLRADAGTDCPPEKLVNFILIDSSCGGYSSPLSLKLMAKLGIQVIDTSLVSRQSASYYDANLLVGTLLSLT